MGTDEQDPSKEPDGPIQLEPQIIRRAVRIDKIYTLLMTEPWHRQIIIFFMITWWNPKRKPVDFVKLGRLILQLYLWPAVRDVLYDWRDLFQTVASELRRLTLQVIRR